MYRLLTNKRRISSLTSHNSQPRPQIRIDTEELKALLRKHNNAFTEDEIVEIGELFYAGKSGGSVSFDKFVQAIDRVVQRKESENVEYDSEGNVLDLGSCGNEYLFYKSHGYVYLDDYTNEFHNHFYSRLEFFCLLLIWFIVT